MHSTEKNKERKLSTKSPDHYHKLTRAKKTERKEAAKRAVHRTLIVVESAELLILCSHLHILLVIITTIITTWFQSTEILGNGLDWSRRRTILQLFSEPPEHRWSPVPAKVHRFRLVVVLQGDEATVKFF